MVGVLLFIVFIIIYLKNPIYLIIFLFYLSYLIYYAVEIIMSAVDLSEYKNETPEPKKKRGRPRKKKLGEICEENETNLTNSETAEIEEILQQEDEEELIEEINEYKNKLLQLSLNHPDILTESLVDVKKQSKIIDKLSLEEIKLRLLLVNKKLNKKISNKLINMIINTANKKILNILVSPDIAEKYNTIIAEDELLIDSLNTLPIMTIFEYLPNPIKSAVIYGSHLSSAIVEDKLNSRQ